jgi:hypothetical protein
MLNTLKYTLARSIPIYMSNSLDPDPGDPAGSVSESGSTPRCRMSCGWGSGIVYSGYGSDAFQIIPDLIIKRHVSMFTSQDCSKTFQAILRFFKDLLYICKDDFEHLEEQISNIYTDFYV